MTNDHADTPGSVTPREYFAAMAMQALLPLPQFLHDPNKLLNMSFQVANAMVRKSTDKSGQP